MDKNSFILYTEYSKHINLLSNEQSGILFKNIFSYITGGEIADMDAVTEMAFSFIKADLDRNTVKYEEVIEKKRIAGAMGGRKKAENRLANVADAKSATNFLASDNCARTNVANLADNDNDNENVNVNDKYKRKSNKFCDYPQSVTDFAALERKVFKN